MRHTVFLCLLFVFVAGIYVQGIAQRDQGGGLEGRIRHFRGSAKYPHQTNSATINKYHRMNSTRTLSGVRRLVPLEYPTIQAAIDSSSNGDTVLVSNGTYLENIRFKGKAIIVSSLFLVDGDTSHIAQTVIDGSNPSNPDSASVVYFIDGEDTTSVLCGFTITGGAGTLWTSWSQTLWRLGGGVYCDSSSHGAKIISNHITQNHVSGQYASSGGVDITGDQGFLILEKNHIYDNHVSAGSGGGRAGGVAIVGDGMYARIVENVFEQNTVVSQRFAVSGAVDLIGLNSLADGVIRGNVFRENSVNATAANGLGGAIGMGFTGSITITENLFEGNIAKSRDAWAEGGALIIDDEPPSTGYGRKMVTGNRFINNLSSSQFGNGTGAAIEIFKTLATVNGNYFEQNTAQGGTAVGGAIRIYASAFRLENNLLVDNIASYGGAVHVQNTSSVGTDKGIINNTMVNNHASSGGGGIYIGGGVQPSVVNSILWGNTPTQIALNGGSILVRYSDIQGGYSGTGNINVNPYFANTIDYQLSDSSLCIGAGIDSIQLGGVWYYAPPTDIGGNTRPNPEGSMPDMGAQENPLSLPDRYILVPQYFSTIQAGIDAASDGKIVIVDDGTYLENINFKGKAITVASYYILDGDTNHINNTIIDGSQPSNPDSSSVVYFISGEDTTSIIYGLTITGGTGTIANPIYWESARGGGGIFCYNSNARITHNIIENNTVDEDLSLEAWGGGIYSRADTLISTIIIIEENAIMLNTINADSGAFGGGIYLNSNARIVDNFISKNICNSTLASYGGGLTARDYFYTGHTLNMKHNTITYNQALSSNSNTGGTGGGFQTSTPKVHIINNNISYNKSGGPGDCWASAFMLYQAQEGSTIEDNIISYNNSADGNLSGTINIVECNGVQINRNQIKYNSAHWGAGIRNDYGNKNIIENNQLIDNDAYNGGAIYMYDSSPIIQNNIIAKNEATYGGGIQIFSGTSTTNLEENSGNKDQDLTTRGVFKNVLGKGNTRKIDKILNPTGLAFSKPVIINNTIVNNTAYNRGGGIRTNNSNTNALVINSILWSNDAPSGAQISAEGGLLNVVYSNVQDSWTGVGNIDVNPFFADTIDYQLSDASLCIGAGIDSIQIGGNWYMVPLEDISGNPRPNPAGSMPDLGAWESINGPVGIQTSDIKKIPRSFRLSQNYPNPFNPVTTIEFSLPKASRVNLKIFNVAGQVVKNLIQDHYQASTYSVEWDGTNDSGIKVASGIYIYRFTAGNFIKTHKMMLLK